MSPEFKRKVFLADVKNFRELAYINSKSNYIVCLVSELTFKCNSQNLNMGRPQNIYVLNIFKGRYNKLEGEILLIQAL